MRKITIHHKTKHKQDKISQRRERIRLEKAEVRANKVGWRKAAFLTEMTRRSSIGYGGLSPSKNVGIKRRK